MLAQLLATIVKYGKKAIEFVVKNIATCASGLTLGASIDSLIKWILEQVKS